MKLDTPEIAWHGKEPILSVDFSKVGSKWRLATAGADNDVKIWSIACGDGQKTDIDFLANLSRHTKAVNVVKFSPKDEILASGGDDSMIILWKLNNSGERNTTDIFMDADEIPNKESWTFHKALRGHIEDIYDLQWSPDGNNIISGSVDNSAIIWDIVKGQKLVILKDHKHYVQGVCWDPLGQYVVTNSSDRSCRLYNPNSYRCCYNITKLLVNGSQKPTENGEAFKHGKMFHDETLPSFFRRPSFSPDGSLLLVPAGRLEVGDQIINTTYVFTRGSPNKPVLYLPSPQKATVAVRCCPILFELRQAEGDGKSAKSIFKLPYRMVFSVATIDSILLYDTQQAAPFGYITNIHYATLTDLTWSSDGSMLVASSSDGYCTIVHFKEGELGVPCSLSIKQVLERSNSPLLQSSDTSGKMGKNLRASSHSEKEKNEEKCDKIPQSTKKEQLGKISMFTVPMKITPTKPARKGAPKTISLAPAPSKPGAANPVSEDLSMAASISLVQSSLPAANTAGLQQTHAGPKHVTLSPAQGQLNGNNSSGQMTPRRVALAPGGQMTPRRVALMPAGSCQPNKSSAEIKPTTQVTPRHVALAPVEGASKPENTVTETKEGKQVLEQVLKHNTLESSPASGNIPPVDDRTRETLLMQLSSPSQTTLAPRRVPLVTLAIDLEKACTKESSQASQPPGTSSISDLKTLVNENVTNKSTEPTLKQSVLARCDKTCTTDHSKPRRIALTPVPAVTQIPSITSPTEKENSTVNQPPQPRRVMLTTLEPLGGGNTQVEQPQGSFKKCLTKSRHIPLEPKIIVLDD